MAADLGLPAPIEVPWTMKPVDSAKTSIEFLDDGRLHLSIEHDVIHGVTPDMLVWWFRNLDRDCEINGRRYPRYRIWHPRDHVAFRYATLPPGGAGPGAVFHIHEVFDRNPDWRIDVLTDVTRLDAGGFAHRPRMHGLRAAAMDYTFERVPGGTLYRNSLTVGIALPSALRAINRGMVTAAFGEARGRAWLKHNIEEVGNFEFFLPRLYAQEH